VNQLHQRGAWNGQRGTYGQRQVTQQFRDRNRWANGGWNRNWRNDHRYDWRNYRNHHRSSFHLGIYYDPFGYNYQPFDIGYQLAPLYFEQRYWIDPAMYELPYPPPGTEWIRYWNDAVLVDLNSGEAVDVIHDFFW
jgi:Ni/Co efflux regulator RcnB